MLVWVPGPHINPNTVHCIITLNSINNERLEIRAMVNLLKPKALRRAGQFEKTSHFLGEETFVFIIEFSFKLIFIKSEGFFVLKIMQVVIFFKGETPFFCELT